jgi:eukaryotic-like serine/threonine-protein kinase
MRPNPGDLVGNKYRVARLIGDGGMGVVYEARHEVLGTAVALKFLHAELARRPGLASRFVQEAKVSASIQSPHVTRVTDVDSTAEGLPYMVMELLVGESLQQLLDRRRKLPADQAVDFAVQIASGLEAAHALGVVHRDLKPDNVFITPSPGGPLLKLLDFGIAKLRESSEYKKGLTRPGAIMGTPEYMAPEQLYAADRVDHRADIYSLGVLLYEMLTGERPANGDDAQQIVGQVIAGKVKPITEHDPSFPDALAKAVHRALQPDKALRFASASEMRQVLAPFTAHKSFAPRASSSPAPGEIAPVSSLRGQPVATIDAPVQVSSSVAPTLPPEGPPPERPSPSGLPRPAFGKGSTQRAPQASSSPAPAGQSGFEAAPVSHYALPPALPAVHYSAQPRAKSGRATAAIVALLLGILLSAGAIVLLLLLRKDPNDPLVEPANPPATTLTPQGPPPELPPMVDPQVPASKPGARPTPAPNKPRGDAGAKQDGGAKTDAGAERPAPANPFPFPMPSGFPPIPSGFPPFPFPFPKPPPASSANQ